MVDLAVPFSPRTSTPPTSGETVVNASASAMSSAPTMAVNGYVRMGAVAASRLVRVSAPAPGSGRGHRVAAGRQERPGSRIAAQLLEGRDPVTVAGPLRILRTSTHPVWNESARRGPPDSIRPSGLM